MKELLEKIRQESPRIHCISNLVSANDTANILLAMGAKPILAQAEQETQEIAGVCNAVVLNCGTPELSRFRAMEEAGKGALKADRPVILDPVGAGASSWRMCQIKGLLEAVHPTVIHCNYSECCALLGEKTPFCGVDSISGEQEERRKAAEALARKYRCVVLVSGPKDVIADREKAGVISGGSRMMGMVTGTGCMLSAMIGAFCAVCEDSFSAAATASSYWKACAEAAEKWTEQEGGGPGMLHWKLMDAAYLLKDWRENVEIFGKTIAAVCGD